MEPLSGPPRYYFLRKAPGQEDVANWPPVTKPLDGPNNTVCTTALLYPAEAGWRAECADRIAPLPNATEPPLVLTRATALALLQDGKRTKADVALMGVRVVNLDGKGVEYATHLVVRALAGFGLGTPRRAVIVPIEAMVLGEYVERGSHAEAALDLRVTPAELSTMPVYLPDDVIERLARRNLDNTVLSTARFYSYGNLAKHGLTLEVEAGRVSLHGRVDLSDVGDQVRAAMLATPGVVEVADHFLYIEDLQAQAQAALEAKKLGYIQVLSEHALIVLSGEVPDSATRYQAEDLVKSIPGVRGVVNDLMVKAPASAPSASAKG
jgi:BON domain